MFQSKDRPDKNQILFSFRDRQWKFEIPAKKVQKVSVDLVVLDREKLEPILASDVSLLAPAKE
jgi:sporulation protein YlmC with PRC-barrel domain